MRKPNRRLNALAERLADVGTFARYTFTRFAGDRCLQMAASLSYTSVLALVPLMAVGFAVLTAFPVFDRIQEDLQDFIIGNFIPDAGAVLQAQVAGFVQAARNLTGIGVLALAVTALILLATIESALNTIWRVERSRPFVQRFLVYWAILTLGPMLLGTSLSLFSYVFTATHVAGVESFTGPLGRFTRILPFLLVIVAFALLYVVVPNRAVRWRHAAAGALAAALLFEALQRGFALYLLHFPAYQAIYGALSAVPVFLVWMYVSWAVVLFGAEIAASLPEWRRTGSSNIREGDR